VSVKVADVLRKVPHVVAVSPVVTQISTTGTVEVVYGIDLASYESLGGPFHYLEGGPFQGPDDIIVDDFFADAQKVHAGSALEVLNHDFRVVGIVEHGKGARKFMPIATVQEMIGAQGKASIFYLKLDNPANADAVAAQIKLIPGMEKYGVQSMQQWLSLMTASNLPGLSTFIDVVIGVAVCIGFIVIFQAMYTAVMERTREIGILKSLGASKGYIVQIILRETLLMALAGVVLGILLSLSTAEGIRHQFPTLRVLITNGWILRAALIAFAGALLGAVYPAFKAAQKDPVDALAYE
ncbi:MAG: ABC transporter permease, partial [Acidobacteriota bacterium]|nr:ABC transporter permease [Acidobacteriota bacterium]